MPELMMARELEAPLKIDLKTIYSYVQRGLIPRVRVIYGDVITNQEKEALAKIARLARTNSANGTGYRLSY